MEKRKYDSTVARIAGNIAAGMVLHPNAKDVFQGDGVDRMAIISVRLAKAIVAEVERTEPTEAAK